MHHKEAAGQKERQPRSQGPLRSVIYLIPPEIWKGLLAQFREQPKGFRESTFPCY